MARHWSPDDAPDQTGRVAVVTGANTGLGYETALVLAQKGVQVILACRNRDKGEGAKKRLLQRIAGAQLDVWPIDTGSLKSVREFAEAFERDHDRLDLLINNAGIMMTPYFETEDGFEGQLGVNYLGHFLLTGLLLPRLNETAGARMVSLYSIAHEWGGIQFDDIHFRQHYDPRKAYSQSKMACLMFGMELDRRLKAAGQGTLSLAAHPGFSKSDLSRNLNPLLRVMLSLFGNLIMQPTAAGALPSLYAALGEDLEGGEAVGPAGAGQRKGPPTVVDVDPEARDVARRERLWRVSEELCGFEYPV